LQFIPGVEVAIGHRGAVYHLLLYGFDPDNAGLQAMLEESRLKLWHKKQLMAASLRRQGYQLPEYPANTNPGSTSPVYELARELVAIGKNQPFTFPQAWELCRQVEPKNRAALAQPAAKALAVAKAAGAIAILAHPARAGAEIASASDQTLLALLEMGLDGVEAYYPAHSPLETRHLVNFASRQNLLVSCGSDSHDERKKPVNWNTEFCRDLLELLLQNQSLPLAA
jgi:predicted metal-dependent phosphoesterase TrpH